MMKISFRYLPETRSSHSSSVQALSQALRSLRINIGASTNITGRSAFVVEETGAA
jgi:hypothetical protein